MLHKFSGIKWDIFKGTFANQYPLLIEGALAGAAFGGLKHALSRDNDSFLLGDLAFGTALGTIGGLGTIGFKGLRNISRNSVPASNKIFGVPGYYLDRSFVKNPYLLNTSLGAFTGGVIGGFSGRDLESMLLGGLGGAAIGAGSTYIPQIISKYKVLNKLQKQFPEFQVDNKWKAVFNPFI